jgi:hypoxanthine-DNA glycosylase
MFMVSSEVGSIAMVTKRQGLVQAPVHARGRAPEDAVVTPASVPLRLQGLAPLASPVTRILILGSFPGAASLAAQQYYGHPRNHFWPILFAIFGTSADHPAVADYAGRCAWLLAHGVGVWDVYGSCERKGSLDSDIRDAEVNDFAALARQCPELRAVGHNGGESWRHTHHLQGLNLPTYRLPSTSPANASWSFERKLAAWREVFHHHELI